MKVVNCARCGGEHDVNPITFARPFAPPEAAPVVWSKYAVCPNTLDPILISECERGYAVDAVLENGAEEFDEALDVTFAAFARMVRLGPERDAFKAVVRELFATWKGCVP